MATVSNTVVRTVISAVIGALIGGGAVAYRDRNHISAAAVGSAAIPGLDDVRGKDDLEALRADVARLKANTPSQSHTMSDVGYHWTNLWFAGEKKNWSLAKFYFDESRDHILWTIRLRPVRKGLDGQDVNLVPIFASIDTSALNSVADAIQAQNSAAFSAAYRMTLEACYGCHKASGKPYLRPMVPTVPAQSIINFDGTATWPQ